ncbi:DsbA family oxidoreductase [Halomonas korlensis]|uniref:Predicted dithiol-disulfide isomerase, DsbA family n=1 Tax=Halomonas korlensis TaxID=463301 RepID=A0A1I7JL27_9GAMM|nr:DsbA family protein [Halomonas korlensis]SFU85905.1 Predicted dithiol-disulfide isomerase, DsbA family [Halomonas korlensis]
MPPARITLDVFSDYVCPFCYLELPELDAVLERFGDVVNLRWRAFELRPDPAPTLDPDGDYLHDIWARAVYPMATERGMTLRLPKRQPRSRLAHEASAWADAEQPDKAEVLRRALFRGFFENSLNLADTQALVNLAYELGLNGGALNEALVAGHYRGQVLADQRQAHDLGISGVPGLRFSIDGEHAGILEGAQPRRQLLLAVERLLDATRSSRTK